MKETTWNTHAGCATLVLAAAAAPLLAQAQGSWPAKPVRMVIPWPPGGGNDILGRILAEPLASTLGQSFVVENRGGSNGLIGAELVARSAPDGYTIMFHSVTSHMLNPAFYPKVPYDTINDFQPITLVGEVPLVILAHPSLPARNVKELIALAKKQPGQMSWASFGVGSASHLGGELFMSTLDLRMIHVPYKGGGPAMIDVLGGHVPIYFSSLATAIAPVRSGKLRGLALTAASRTKLLPDVPTVNEAAGITGYDATIMYGVFAPAKSPGDIVRRLNETLGKLLRNPEIVGKLEGQGLSSATPGTPEEMSSYIKSNIARWAKVVRDSGVKVE
ncbi:MAG: tripartite tricarboxylate transporter substrate binding protein [Proteobacteria bacterium]|nr:tripartite tricarboxylate transporter substrate binding protein [Burkholderiales bacterium]